MARKKIEPAAYTPRQAGEYMNKAYDEVIELVKTGQLAAYNDCKVPGKTYYKILREDIDEYVRKKKDESMAKVMAKKSNIVHVCVQEKNRLVKAERLAGKSVLEKGEEVRLTDKQKILMAERIRIEKLRRDSEKGE